MIILQKTPHQTCALRVSEIAKCKPSIKQDYDDVLQRFNTFHYVSLCCRTKNAYTRINKTTYHVNALFRVFWNILKLTSNTTGF